jgi:hypothetical protein
VKAVIRKTSKPTSRREQGMSVLNKKTCKKCVWSCWSWDNDDEDRWSKGKILCELCKGWTWSIKKSPPPECPYKLEHAVAAGLRKKNAKP